MSIFSTKRTHILQQMAELQSMEFGSLKEEYRTNASGGTAGPYYQFQAWHEGANLSRRVPAEEAPSLKETIANLHRFEALAEEFLQTSLPYPSKLFKTYFSLFDYLQALALGLLDVSAESAIFTQALGANLTVTIW